MSHAQIQLIQKKTQVDVPARHLKQVAENDLKIDPGQVRSGKILQVHEDLSEEQLFAFAQKSLKDPITQDLYVNCSLSDPFYKSYILFSKRPGVTDDEGMSAQKALCDFLEEPVQKKEQHVFTQEVFFLERELKDSDLSCIAHTLGNPLIHEFHYGAWEGQDLLTEEKSISIDLRVEFFDFIDLDLEELSRSRQLCLNIEEMQAIRAYYENPQVQKERERVSMKQGASDCELEILAQTWSEHCKHKEFNALIHFSDLETGRTRQISSLFQSKIRASTNVIWERLKEKGHNWLVKVFSDNAGVVRIDQERLFVWKVETHNTPSALDPYGGAITGILGNNRDALGTGVGGAKLLFNTNVLCFGNPLYDKPLLKGQLHPKRIMKGVVEGIMDGGNKSGVPTVNGSIVFDDRYAGKPLVFCGTGAVMPQKLANKESWKKPVAVNDRIVMAGGRVGKDGIHGATLSSAHVDAATPQTVVQIGSPMTQKLLADFLHEACQKGLVKTCTDNGAGGLSSSVGEMAQATNGAKVDLSLVPLKYSGLLPWEIFLSESQERMTLVVNPKSLEELFDLAKDFEVELSDIGFFTDSGFLDVRYEDSMVAYLSIEFLHEGLPQKKMEAEWTAPLLSEPGLSVMGSYDKILCQLLGSLNICSKEEVIRRYDHEVKGQTVMKPLMGPEGLAPQDAAVLRLGFDSFEGLAVSNGILPRYGDIDPYHMSAGAFDEAVRSIVAVGGQVPDLSLPSSPFWSVNDNFCVPDSAYHPTKNPDGKLKLAKLVKMCDALYDMALAYNIPMTSGKDSMKNDFHDGEKKISVPPTVLYSMVSLLPDIRLCTSSEFKASEDRIYLLGTTYNELGASEFYRLFGELGAFVPKVRPEEALSLYRLVAQAHKQRLLESCHDLSDGGLAVALAESAFGGGLGVDVELKGDDPLLECFSESHSRFIVSVRPENVATFESLFQQKACVLGLVQKQPQFILRWKEKVLVDTGLEQLKEAWQGGLCWKEG